MSGGATWSCLFRINCCSLCFTQGLAIAPVDLSPVNNKSITLGQNVLFSRVAPKGIWTLSNDKSKHSFVEHE